MIKELIEKFKNKSSRFKELRDEYDNQRKLEKSVKTPEELQVDKFKREEYLKGVKQQLERYQKREMSKMSQASLLKDKKDMYKQPSLMNQKKIFKLRRDY